MFSKKFIFCLIIIGFVFIAPAVSAQGLKGAGNIVSGIAKEAGADTYQTPQVLIGTGINAALAMVGLIFLILMIYAGYLWLTSHGEEEPIKKAQKIIVSSVIGFILVASAYAVTVFVGKRFEVGGGGVVAKKTSGEAGGEAGGNPNLQVCCWVCKEKLWGDFYDEPVVSGMMSEAACKMGCTGEDNDECKFDYDTNYSNDQAGKDLCKEDAAKIDCDQYEN